MILINDAYWQTHGIYIKQAIMLAYPEYDEDDIINIANYTEAIQYAASNTNVEAFIRSTTGVASYVNDAKQLYPRVLFFMPMGSNSFQELQIFNQEEPPVIVTSGAGDEEGRNNTGYGKGLEFWDWDLTQTQEPSEDQSSYSNGIILGKLLKIKHTLNCSWWEARWRARVTADRTEPNRETYPWDIRNGYGRINVDRAVSFKGYIPPDPYLDPTIVNQPLIKGLIKEIETPFGIGSYIKLKLINIEYNKVWFQLDIYDEKQAYLSGKLPLGTKFLKLNQVSINFNNSLYELLTQHPLLQGAVIDQ